MVLTALTGICALIRVVLHIHLHRCHFCYHFCRILLLLVLLVVQTRYHEPPLSS